MLPPALAARKMTNPDAPVNEHCIEVTVDGAKVWGMPILLSREERFDPAAGRAFFEYLTLSMLLVDRSGATARPLTRDGAPVLVPLNRVDGFSGAGRPQHQLRHSRRRNPRVELRAARLGRQTAPSPELLERIRAELVRAVAR